MPVRIVVGKRITKKFRIQIREFPSREQGIKEKTSRSENIVLYDEEGVIDIKEMAKSIKQAVTEYAKKKGEVEEY